MNLLYKEYRKGCYVGWSSSAGDYEVGSYCYGYGTEYSSYYADLQPNTTYTIKRYDTSTRLRIALTSQDVKQLTSNSGTAISTFTWGYRADTSDPVTFTTGADNIHLVVYYTNNSEYDTRIMLNEGSTAEEYEEPTEPIFPPEPTEAHITDFEQGEFNVNTGNFYSSTTDVRSGLHRINPCKISVDCGEGITWTFICYNSDFIFTQINESSGFKSSGDIVDISSYSWVRYIRIELHDTNGISPPAECTLNTKYAFRTDSKGSIVPTNAPERPEKAFSKPYPKNLWRIYDDVNDGKPFHELMPDFKDAEPAGAFKDAAALEYVYIPTTVRKIGRYAFAGTALKSVTIPTFCNFYPTSFPEDCEINFY